MPTTVLTRLKAWWKSLLWWTAIPMAAVVLLPLVRNHQQSRWLENVQLSNPNLTAEQLQAVALDNVCSDGKPSSQVGHVCADQTRLTFLTCLAAIALIVGLLIPLTLFIAGQRCRKDRRLLLHVFRRALLYVNISTTGLMVTQAVIGIAVLVYVPLEFASRIPTGMILVTGLGALSGCVALIRTMFGMAHEVSTPVLGMFVHRSDEPKLWALVDDVAKCVGTEPPANIVAGLDYQFFVTETEVRTSAGQSAGRTLYLSTPLSRILTVEELRAIVGHELAHFKGDDTAYSLQFYPIYRGAINALLAVSHTAQQLNRGSLTLLPAIHLYSFFLSNFSEAEASISRERELEADRVASTVSSPLHFCSALGKVTLYGGVWVDLLQTPKRWLSADKDDLSAGIGRQFQLSANNHNQHEGWQASLSALGERSISHPTDSHPPLQIRLESLGQSIDDLRDHLAIANSDQSASTLISGIDEIEWKLTGEVRSKYDSAFASRNLTFTQLED